MTTSKHAVAILPYSKELGLQPRRLSVDELCWPFGIPVRLEGKSLKDLSPNDHLIIYPLRYCCIRPSFGTSAKVSIMIVEPEIYHGKHIERLRLFYWRFFRVLTAVEQLAYTIPNGILFPFGSTWIPNWQEMDVTKTRMISLIASEKCFLPGHLVRHEVAKWALAEGIKIDTIGRGYQPFDKKMEGLAPYRFSVVIENSIEPNYFTEKLIDAILCETIPIYLGCPNIDRFLDTRGMIICKNSNDIRRAVASVSAELYCELIPKLRAIKSEAGRLANTEMRAAEAVLAAG